MVKKLGDFDLIDESLLPILLWKCSLFSKCLYSDSFLIPQTDPKIDSCKITFSQSFLRLEKIMKIVLVHQMLALSFPFFQILNVLTVKLLWLESWTYKFDTVWSAQALLLWFILGSQYLENSIETDHESDFHLFIRWCGIEYWFIGENKSTRTCVIWFEVEGGS